MKQLIIILCFFTVFAAGCDQTQPVSENRTVQKKPDQEKPLIIGLIPEQSIFKQLERYEPLARYLEKRIGRKIELKVLTRYGDFIDNFIELKMDGMFLGSFTFVLAHSKLGIQAIARPENKKGISSYHGMIFVRKDSGIRTPGDMKGKRFVFVDQATTAGYLFPLAYFKQNGIEDYRAFFQETYFAGTHADAIYDVLQKKADIGAAKNTIFENIARLDPRVNHELAVMKISSDVPENALAVRYDLAPSLIHQLKDHLLNMHNDLEGQFVLQNFGARRFIDTGIRDYQPVLDLLKLTDMDLTKFDYRNE